MTDRSEPAGAAANDVTLEVLRQLEQMAELAARLKAEASVEGVEASARALAQGAEDVRRLVEQARDLARLERGQLALEPTTCKLRNIVAAVEDAWRERANTAGIAYTVTYEGDAHQAAEVDCDRLMQLFDVLVGRAFAETAKGRIEVSLRVLPLGENLTLEGSVRDTGRSLSAEELAHIFDPAETTRAEATASLSTRIGMALANRLVQALSGVLQAQVNDGGGVTVTFDLLVPAASIEKPRSLHVLIVDDNMTNRMVAEAMCDLFDCTCEQAADGVEAVEAAKTRAFDLILMDITMPRMDGVEATRQIRGLPGPVSRTPIIALTASADREDVIRYMEAGMNDVIEKPIKPDRLAAVLMLLGAAPEDGAIAAA
jgi:CheY-like chemotaxis protein